MNLAQTITRQAERGESPERLVIAREDGFDFASLEYRALFDRAAATAFQHPVWLGNFYRILAPHRGADAVIVAGRDPRTNVLRLVLPMIRRTVAGIGLLEAADLGASDYAAPVVDPRLDLAPGIARQVRAALPPADYLRVKPIREEHLPIWRTLLGGRAFRQDFSAHAVSLAGDHGGWRERALDASFRKMLDRKKKRFFKQGGAVRLLSGEAEIRKAVARIAQLRAGRFEGDLIQARPVEEFYAAVAVAGAATGTARTYAIAIDGEDFGYAFGTTAAGRFDYLLIGCDYDTHGRHSPGLILYDEMIADWMANGGDCFDFTIGDEPFKMQFGTSPTPIFALEDALTWRGTAAAAGIAAKARITDGAGALRSLLAARGSAR